jgi:L-asparaginase
VVPEVAVYFEYSLYRGNRTVKVHAERFEAFRSPNWPRWPRPARTSSSTVPRILPRAQVR